MQLAANLTQVNLLVDCQLTCMSQCFEPNQNHLNPH